MMSIAVAWSFQEGWQELALYFAWQLELAYGRLSKPPNFVDPIYFESRYKTDGNFFIKSDPDCMLNTCLLWLRENLYNAVSSTPPRGVGCCEIENSTASATLQNILAGLPSFSGANAASSSRTGLFTLTTISCWPLSFSRL